MKTSFFYPVDIEIKAREFIESFYVSKSKAYLFFQNKEVYLNGSPIVEATILKPKDVIELRVEEEIDFHPNSNPITILYEDDYLLAVNKPNDIIIHSDDKTDVDTLASMVGGYYDKKDIHLNVRYAHRLDKETTGVVLFCKDPLTLAYMNHFISTHEIRREYRALVQGTPKNKNGRLTYLMGSDRHVNGKMVVSKNGKEAITNYTTLFTYKGYSLVKVLLETGRTHQIRLHMSHYGCPLLGDTLYGGSTRLIDRVALHSYKMEFIHPVTKNPISIVAPIPKDMRKLMGAEE